MVDPTIAARLSDRREAPDEDREILDLMSQGVGYAEMAERLGTTQEAIDRRVTALFVRLAGGGGGASRAVDELKRLHEAVVERSNTADAPWCSRRSRSPSCSATSAGSRQSPSGLARAISPT
jgi:hypothetical protein